MYYKVVTRKKCKRRSSHKKWVALFFVLLTLSAIAMFFVYNMSCAAPTIVAFAQSSALSKTTQAVNKAVYTVLSSGVRYDELVTVEKNTNNEIVLISANSVLINYIAKETAVLVQQSINQQDGLKIQIPWGTLTGFNILVGKGSNVNLEILPISSVVCSFQSNFQTAGINQTLHQIFLNVNIDLQVILPTKQEVFNIKVPVIVSEKVIVGVVPDTFLNATILGSQQTA